MADVVPVAAARNLETIVLRENGVLFVAAGLSQCRRVLLVVNVRDAFEKEQREDVRFEVGGINWAAKDVGGLPKMGFELAQSRSVVGHWRFKLGRPLRQARPDCLLSSLF